MTIDISRRAVLGTVAGSAAVIALSGTAAGQGQSSNPAGLRLMTSVDGVFTPPRGAGIMKFSFANPEPSVEFAGLLFGFEIITFENNYGIDPASVTVARSGDVLTLTATRLLYAGGQQQQAGRLVARLRRTMEGAVEWDVAGELDRPIKSIKTIVRGLPRGRLSASAEDWKDYGDDEKVFEYPALLGGMATPLMAIDGGDKRIWGISAIQTEVRPARFAFLPGPDGYKIELLWEQAGWDRRNAVTSCGWRIAASADFAGIARPHFATVRANWSLPDFRTRADTPNWAKHISCVLSLHGQHWTGHVFNDFDQQLEILRWAAKQTDPRHVLVFLTGWDARYYWDYPAFAPGAGTGGPEGFTRLIAEGKKLGFRFALMFGSNIANPVSPIFPRIADAVLRDPYGSQYPSNYVDWDGDRKGDSSMVFMNLAVESWRNHLTARIADMVGRYKLDAYFLDICGLWENNPDGDMLEGLRTLVSDLAQRFPDVPAVAEMQYDAQMAFIPINQVPRYSLWREANFGVVASFSHLSWPAPGLGSTGVHEFGFSTYKPVILDNRKSRRSPLRIGRSLSIATTL